MRSFYLNIITIILMGCSGLETADSTDNLPDAASSLDIALDSKTRADRALAEAERIGNSGPIYDLYVSCLDNSWNKLLASGTEENQAYQLGIDQCAYELNLLCDFYGDPNCYADAELSNRLLFSEFHSL